MGARAFADRGLPCNARNRPAESLPEGRRGHNPLTITPNPGPNAGANPGISSHREVEPNGLIPGNCKPFGVEAAAADRIFPARPMAPIPYLRTVHCRCMGALKTRGGFSQTSALLNRYRRAGGLDRARSLFRGAN